MMMQNVKYDSLTGKVYEELGCSAAVAKTTKSDVAVTAQTTKNDALKNVTKDVDENLSTNVQGQIL